MKVADKKNSKEFSRRDFLKTSGAVTGGFIGGSLLGGLVGFNLDGISGDEQVDTETKDGGETASSSGDTDSFSEARVFFKRQEDFEILSAATELIFPKDNIGPGAIELGVPFFIDKQLITEWGINAMDYMSHPFQEGEVPLNRQNIFMIGIRRLNSFSEEEFDSKFLDLDDERKVNILTQFENNEVEVDYIDSSSFFSLLRQSTIDGVYADPLYGGNKNMEGWKMKEFPGAQLSYRNMMEEDESLDKEFILIEPISLNSNS